MKNRLNFSKFIRSKWFRWLCCTACAVVLVFSLLQIGLRLYRYEMDNRKYEAIREQFQAENPGDQSEEIFDSLKAAETDTSPQDSGEAPIISGFEVVHGSKAELNADGILPEYAKLKKLNPDLIGWISFPGFEWKLDYPVMQASDNSFYLTRDFYRNDSQAGSVFMDSGNRPLQSDRHMILYGHAMNNLSMFGNLKDYPLKPEKHTRLTKIYLDLLNTRMEFEVFSTYIAKASFNYRQIGFDNDKAYLSFLKRIQSLSVHAYGVPLSSKDRILTLSTCNRTLLKDNRSVVHAKLVRQIVYN